MLQVAFIFTILPYPITDHSVLRQNVGGSLYLLANYYSVVHESIQVRTKDMEGDPADKMRYVLPWLQPDSHCRARFSQKSIRHSNVGKFGEVCRVRRHSA